MYALGEWSTVLSRWGALGLALTQKVSMIQKWAGEGCSAHIGTRDPWDAQPSDSFFVEHVLCPSLA